MMANANSTKAVVLLSGGLDSATTLAWAQQQGFACYALSFDYGQRHKAELVAAKRVAKAIGVVEHNILPLCLDAIGGSALTDTTITVPDYAPQTAIPVTYVPARNTIFLSMALGWAEVLGAEHIVIGVNAIDYSGYPDCRPAFIDAFEPWPTSQPKPESKAVSSRFKPRYYSLAKRRLSAKVSHMAWIMD